MVLAAEVLFWGGVGLLGYTLAGYGLAVKWISRLRAKPVRKRNIRPIVSVLVVAHNEGGRIATKIENLLALDYPPERLEIVIASDGSTDDTVSRARAFEPRVRVVAMAARRGKPAVLNQLVPTLRGSVVVLADTRQRFDQGAVAALVRGFADPTVGAVSGELILLKEGDVEAAAGKGAALYWDQEKRIRFHESRIDAAIGATGAIYAIRRELFERIPDDTILDDVLIPMHITRRGYRVIFESRARAFDRRATNAREEFVRKVRTIAGNFQMFTREPWLLNPGRNRLWIQTLSHKGLRLVLPVMLVVTLASNLLLLDHLVYQLTLAGQVAFFAVAMSGWVWPEVRTRLSLLVIPYTMCFLCFATVVGFLRFVAGRQAVTWERTAAS